MVICYYSFVLKSFDRYILKEIAAPFTIGLLVYTFTLLINNILLLSNALISRRASLFVVLKILIYLIPELLSFTIPMSTLMGVLAGLSRMSTDSEIIAFRTMGVNNFRILKPVMLFSLLAWFLSTWLIMYIAPEANFRLNLLLNRVYVSKAVSNIKPMTFYREFPYYVLYFNDFKDQSSEWHNVFMYSMKNGDRDTVILAESGNFIQNDKENEGQIILKNALVHSFKKKEPLENYSLTFYNYLKEEISDLIVIKQTRKYNQLVFPQLVKRMKENPKSISLKLEFHRKFSLPFACLALGFLALSLGISTKKGGKISGFIISLGIIFLYYTIVTASRNMVLKQIIPPIVGMWAANLFLLMTGIILYYYTSKEKSIDWEKVFSFFHRLKKKKGRVLFSIKVRKIKVRIFRILDVYVLKRLLLTFILVFLSLLFVFYIINVVELIDDAIENNVSFYYILQYIYFKTPDIISFILPVSILTAVLVAFSLMSKNNEIVAVQVSGISLYRLSLSALVLGIFLSVSSFFIQEEITPPANKRAQEILSIIHKRKLETDFEFYKNWVAGDKNDFYFYNMFDRKHNRFIKFNIIYFDDKFNMKTRIVSEYAEWLTEKELILVEGFERDFSDNSPIDLRDFSKKKVTIEGGKSFFTRKIAFSKFMNIRELQKYIKYLKKNKSDTKRYYAQLYYKFAFPLSSFIMVLIAIPFSFIMGKRGTLHGIGIAVGISMVFWSAVGIFNSLGTSVILSPFISAFAPHFIFAAFSVYFFINVKT